MPERIVAWVFAAVICIVLLILLLRLVDHM